VHDYDIIIILRVTCAYEILLLFIIVINCSIHTTVQYNIIIIIITSVHRDTSRYRLTHAKYFRLTRRVPARVYDKCVWLNADVRVRVR